MKDLVNLPLDELKRAPGIKKVTKLPLESFRFYYENLERPLVQDFLIEQHWVRANQHHLGGGRGGEHNTIIILVQGFAGMCCVKTSQEHEIIIPMV